MTDDSPCPLTPSEIECIRWAADGKTLSETAEIVGRSITTIAKRMEIARGKTMTINTASLIAECFRKGWMK